MRRVRGLASTSVSAPARARSCTTCRRWRPELRRHRRRRRVRHGCRRLRPHADVAHRRRHLRRLRFRLQRVDRLRSSASASRSNRRTPGRSVRAWACCRARPPCGTARSAIRRPSSTEGASSLPDFKGYFVGAGVESQLVGGWNLRAEYRFSQFDSETVLFDGLNVEPSSHTARLALTYKWGREEACSRSRPDEVVGVAPAFRLLGRSSRSGPFSVAGGLCAARVDAVAMPGRPPSPIRGSRPGHPDAIRQRAAAAD